MRNSTIKVAVLLFIASSMLFQQALAGKNKTYNYRHGESIRGSGKLATEERAIESFDRIELEGSVDVFVDVGKDQSVTVSTDDNLLENLSTEVIGKNTLLISSVHSYSTRLGAEVRITVPSLRSVELEGSGDIEIRNMSGKLFEVGIDGSGDVLVEGEVDELDIIVNGSGDVDAADLVAEVAYVDINGSGNVIVYVKEEIDGNVNGSGDIDILGDPEIVSSNGWNWPHRHEIYINDLYSHEYEGYLEAYEEAVEAYSERYEDYIEDLYIHSIPAVPAIPEIPAVPAIPAIPEMKMEDIIDFDDFPTVIIHDSEYKGKKNLD